MCIVFLITYCRKYAEMRMFLPQIQYTPRVTDRTDFTSFSRVFGVYFQQRSSGVISRQSVHSSRLTIQFTTFAKEPLCCVTTIAACVVPPPSIALTLVAQKAKPTSASYVTCGCTLVVQEIFRLKITLGESTIVTTAAAEDISKCSCHPHVMLQATSPKLWGPLLFL